MRAIGPLRSLFNISGAVYGLFYKPYTKVVHDKSMIKGIGEGFYDLYAVLTEEGAEWTQNVRFNSLINFFFR